MQTTSSTDTSVDLHRAQCETLRLLLPQISGEPWRVHLRMESTGGWIYCRPIKLSVRLAERVWRSMGGDGTRVRRVDRGRVLVIPGDRAGDVLQLLRKLQEGVTNADRNMEA